jgi:MFS family permease
MIGAAAPIISAWIAELMPTRARVTAFTADAVAGAVGGVVGLLVVALLAPRIGLGPSLQLLAAAAAVGAAALLILPETRGVDLPD